MKQVCEVYEEARAGAGQKVWSCWRLLCLVCVDAGSVLNEDECGGLHMELTKARM